jgi:predicted phage terminase large subunit-like protein
MQDNYRLLQAMLRSHFPSFLHKSLNSISPGTKYLHNWHINAISEKLQAIADGKITRLIINIPPRYLKSICVTVAWPAWLLGHNPSTKIMAASYSQALSNKHSQDCRLLINSPWYQDLFPNTKIAKGENQKSKFVTTKRGFRFATSTGGTATGEGGDILIVDDPQNPNKINSKKYRENTIEWFEQTFVSRLNNKKTGAIVIVMQRLHAEDLCGYLLEHKKEQWDLLKLPAIWDEENGTVLHKEREDLASLQKLKVELGEYNFSAQYQQNPVPNKGAMIEKSWLRYFSADEKLEFSQIIQSWDTAIKAKDEHDYSVGITIGVHNNGYYLLDIVRAKAEFPGLINLVKNFANKWQPRAILVEDKASGQSLIQSLELKLPLIAIKPKFDKVTRFAAHTTLFEAGKIFIKSDSNWRLALEQELLSFPKSAHDDQVDALSQAFSYLQQRKIVQLRSL